MEEAFDLSFWKILFTTLKDLSFWTGFVTIIAFSIGRFNEKEPDEQELDPPLPNRCFTSRFRFSSAALIYALVYVAIYSLFVIGGSIPALQGVLTEMFGSLEVGEEIGTPAWAAMMLMVIAPTFKRVREADTRLRRWLMNFANIPFKARELAEDIVAAIRRKRGEPASNALIDLPTATLCRLVENLTDLRELLCSVGGERNKSAYYTFFNVDYSSIAKNVDQRYQTIKNEIAAEAANGTSVDQGLSFRRQLAEIIQRNARLVACALLQVDGEEYRARETVRRRGGYAELRSAHFRFSKSQIVLGLLLVFLTCAILGPIIQFVQLGSSATPGQIWDALERWAYWGVVGAFSYLLPLILAASVQLWLLDNEEDGEERDWMFKITVMLVVLIGCYLLAALPLFLGVILRMQLFHAAYSPQIVTFATVPACTAVLFIASSRRRLDRTRGVNAIIDFLLFGSMAATVSHLTGSLVKLAELASHNIMDMEPLFDSMSRGLLAISLVTFFIGGGFGALHCAASRQLVEATRARRRISRIMPSQGPEASVVTP